MTEQNQPVEEETVTPGADTVQPEPQEPPTYEELRARIAELEGQLKDSELHGLANEQNPRCRHQQEIADTHKFAGQKFAAEMLPVKDHLEIALLGQSGNFSVLKIGVQMTLNESQKVSNTTHIKEINPQPGDKLGPHQHQAMQTVASEQEPNTIVSVMKKGHTLSNRVLRPAMVVVTKKETWRHRLMEFVKHKIFRLPAPQASIPLLENHSDDTQLENENKTV